MKSCSVYLPAGYDECDPDTLYNVLYLLHGVGGDEYEWLRGSGSEGGNHILCNMLDKLVANRDIDPVIAVMPNGRSSHDWTDRTFNSEGTNMLGFYYFDYELRYDLIPFIESAFKTYANIRETSPEAVEYNRTHRAIAGLSMGGMPSIESDPWRLSMRFRDGVSIDCYRQSINGLADIAGDYLDVYYQVSIKGGVHDFNVWNKGAYHFTRLSFGNGLKLD
ncbi:alpha/beta hydrolase [Paenibacillus sp. LPE1-1-1.1]|uniref:alpha/beta hydrolase n=1 Tax=Paenibacillus sp. LPE1-1-1.1 TaxID=3135230 RepID=UPI0039C8D822